MAATATTPNVTQLRLYLSFLFLAILLLISECECRKGGGGRSGGSRSSFRSRSRYWFGVEGSYHNSREWYEWDSVTSGNKRDVSPVPVYMIFIPIAAIIAIAIIIICILICCCYQVPSVSQEGPEPCSK